MKRRMELFIQTVLQDRIDNARVRVMFGQAHDIYRRFDTDHDGFDIIFTIDDVYMENPAEVEKVWNGLKQWIDGWNHQLTSPLDPSEIPEDTNGGDIDTYYSGVLEDESNGS